TSSVTSANQGGGGGAAGPGLVGRDATGLAHPRQKSTAAATTAKANAATRFQQIQGANFIMSPPILPTFFLDKPCFAGVEEKRRKAIGIGDYQTASQNRGQGSVTPDSSLPAVFRGPFS